MIHRIFSVFTLLVVLVGVLSMAHSVLGADRQNLVIVSVPWQKEDELRATYEPLLSLLARKLDREVSLVVAENYEEVGERLHRQAADLAVFGPNGYVEAKERFPDIVYLATCKQPTAYYHSLIITLNTSDIQFLDDLRGRSFGYTDVKSTSGYVYPRMMLEEEGFDPQSFFSRTFLLNKHDKVYEAVAKEAIAAGGVSSTVMPRAILRHGEVFRVLKKSAPIPRNALVAGAHLRESKRATLLKIIENAQFEQEFITSDSILKGFLVRSDSFYDIVRQAKK